MPTVLRLFNIAGSPVATGREGLAAKAVSEFIKRGEPELGEYLQSFNVDAFFGRGDATFTADKNKAMRFATKAEAMLAWKTQSKVRPLRPDGKPNRPLTAFNMTTEEV